MFVIGITGPSGAGKGIAASYLKTKNICTFDADAIYRELITPPSFCLDELVKVFGKNILTAAGELDRPALSKLVFGEENKEKLETLNKITHKFVVNEIRRRILSLPKTDICVIDAPLLIEAGLLTDCDITISVLADKEIRAKRISNRDRISYDTAMARINSQKPDSFYIEHTDFTVHNNGEKEAFIAEIESILEKGGIKI